MHNIVHEEESSMKYCTRCGAVCEDNDAFCKECGSPLPQGSPNYMPPKYPGIIPRSIPLCILFSFITCGIYAIYWMIKMNDEINIIAGEPYATSGVMVFLLSIVTCGIYGYYWMYKMGERSDRIKGANGNSGLLYLLLALFGLGIVSYCLIQDTINKAI